jgi:hypothetical protein
MESYRRELLDAVVEKASEVFGELARAIAEALSDAYYKTPMGTVEPVKVKSATERKIEYETLQEILAKAKRSPQEFKAMYETLSENLEERRNETVGNALSKYLEALAYAVNFVFDVKTAKSLAHRFEFGSYAELPKTNRVVQVAGQYYVFSREAYEAFLQDVRSEALRRGYAVYERGDLIVIEQRPSQPATLELQPVAQPPAQPQRAAYDFDAVLNAIAEGAEVEVSFIVTDPSVVAAFLNAIKGGIKRLQVKSGGWTYTYIG